MITFLEKNKKLPVILTILIAIEIFWFSSLQQTATSGQGTGNFSYLYHFIVFFLLAFFLLSSIKRDRKLKIRYILFSLIISIIYAILDEVHQLFVPGRSCNYQDVLIDTFGILLAILIYSFIYYKEFKYLRKGNITYKKE